MICDIHRRFLEAGADIIETNTFGATSITQSPSFLLTTRANTAGAKDPAFYQKIIEDPFLSGLAWEINEQSARQCREWADRIAATTATSPAVCGRSHGPTHRLALQLTRRGRRRFPCGHVRPGEDCLCRQKRAH